MTAEEKAAAEAAEKKAAAAKGGPKTVEMHRAVHELTTGAGEESIIAAGTIITDELAKAHKLDGKALDRLVTTGAVDMVEVLKG